MKTRSAPMSQIIKTLAQEIGELTAQKNESYGQTAVYAGEILKVLYPDGVRPEQYNDMLLIARVIDKLGRIANRKDAFGENPWLDIAGYGLVAAAVDIARGGSEIPAERDI